MSTLRLSLVATTMISGATLMSPQAVGAPPTCCSDPPTHPVSLRAGNINQETRVFAVQPDEQNAPARARAKADFSVDGMFVDCCSCNPPCPCELTEVAMGCKGVGVHEISRGRYAGADLVGVKIAHAKVVGKWVNLYIDAKDVKQRAAAENFGRAAFAAFGPIKEVKAADIEVSGANGHYTVTVDGGKIMRFETEPLLGGDSKTPIGYTNIKNAVNPTVYQGRVVSATYTDGNDKVTVEKGRNSHFNPKLKSRGRI